ncbi:MAG: permease-like cell division protein FtsX [Patescibacteria group bacterium]
MLTNLKRVLNFAFADFYRHKGISIAGIFVLIITTLLVTFIFFMQGVSDFLVTNIKNKIDVTAYFKADTQEQDILRVKEEILQISPEIKNVEYISKQKAFEDFTQKHRDNVVLSKALLEVGDNPFLPSLNINTTGSALAYEQVSEVLQKEQYNPFIEKVDFSQKKDTIEKIFSITSSIKKFGIGLAILLVLVAVLVVFNTIKLVIDRAKEEISTMKIVGASGWFIKSPFIIQGALFGFISFFFCFFITISSVYFLSPAVLAVLPGFVLFDYFLENLWMIILIQLGFGAGLGVAASFIVVREHLKV